MLAVLFLAGCSILEDEVERGFAQREPLTSVTFTTADVRVIIQRNRSGYPPVVCTEPSPDVAKALSAAAAVSAQGGNGSASGSFAGGGASAKAVAALAGRSTALLGLRDGLYRACEAYANGVIGANAYALVLSRYGQLMTTLFLGQDVTGAAGTNAGPSVQSPPVTVNLSGSAGVSAGPAATPTTSAPSPTGAQPKSATGNPAVALTRMNEDYLNLGYNPDALVIACVNYGDSSRSPRTYNQYLQDLCPTMLNLQAFKYLSAASEELVKNKVLAQPVDPAAMPMQTSPAKQPTKAAPAPANKQIQAAQIKLQVYCPSLKVNGKLGPASMACAKKYEAYLDADAKKTLGVP